MSISKREALSQLHSLRHTGLYPLIAAARALEAVHLGYLFGVASRETNCLNELGDFRNGEYHGVGVLQIDIQHPLARAARDDGSWKTHPGPLIAFGVNLLIANYGAAKKEFPKLTVNHWLKIAASGYNCGIQTAITGAHQGDSDHATTGGDYGRDVMTRFSLFHELLHEQP